MAVRALQFFAILVSALALIPAGAHLAALPNKIGLSQVEYFTVQAIYAGWAILGLLWPVAILLDIALATAVRAQPWPFWLAVLAALCFALALAIFFVWTFPANQATANWTIAPENWEALKREWEYSHAVNTLLLLLAVCLVTASALSWRPGGA